MVGAAPPVQTRRVITGQKFTAGRSGQVRRAVFTSVPTGGVDALPPVAEIHARNETLVDVLITEVSPPAVAALTDEAVQLGQIETTGRAIRWARIAGTVVPDRAVGASVAKSTLTHVAIQSTGAVSVTATGGGATVVM